MPTAQEAAAHVQELNKRIRMPVPDVLKRTLTPAFIFNTHDIEWQVNLGSLGRFIIPACEPGEQYSKPLKVDGFIADEYDLADGTGRMAWFPEEGANVAKDVVGIGSATPQLDLYTTNREWFGVFIAAGERPTKEELASAKAKLTQMMTLLLQHGDRLALQGEKGLAQIGPMERKAAVWLNQKRSWAVLPEKMDNCPGCGEPVRPGVVKHSCGAVLDWDKAVALGMVTEKPKAKKAETHANA